MKHLNSFSLSIASALAGLFLPATAIAQNITFDGTLGPAIPLPGPVYAIPQEFGTTVDSNLFHSFSQFQLSPGETAAFLSSPAISNILGRVTGETASSIDGLLLTTSPSVNLFLLNPNGIVFGPNAQISVGSAVRGSFIASTADGLIWPDGRQFDVIAPQVSSDLLQIQGDPSGFIASQASLQPLQINGSVLAGKSGQSLIFLGGEIQLNDALLAAGSPIGGRIEIAGLAQAGTIPLTLENGTVSLVLDEIVNRANLELNNATLFAGAAQGGNLSLYGKDIALQESTLLAGITPGEGLDQTQSGNILLNAQGTVSLSGTNTSLINSVGIGGLGNAGSIKIVAEQLSGSAGASLITTTSGTGDAGDIQLEIRDRLSLDNTVVISSLDPTATGTGGDITIQANQLDLTNGSQLATVTQGNGDAGNIAISAREQLRLSDTAVISSSVLTTGVGQGGNIAINSPIVRTANGSQIAAATLGRGDAGSIRIIAEDQVSFDMASVASSSVLGNAIGQGGNIEIQTSGLTVSNGAQLAAVTQGQGNAGSITVRAEEAVQFRNRAVASSIVDTTGRGQGGEIELSAPLIEVLEGSQLVTSTQGTGNAGTVHLISDGQVRLSQSSIVASSVGPSGNGNGGSITVNTAKLDLSEQAALIVGTEGQGNVGRIQISASEAVQLNNGALSSSVAPGGEGSDGTIVITTPVLSVEAGGQIASTTFGEGDAGTVQIKATKAINLTGTNSSDGRSSGIFTSNGSLDIASPTGAGGDITLSAPQLSLNQGAVIDARTVNPASGGSIAVDVDRLALRNGGQILTTSDGAGAAGTITVIAQDEIQIIGRDVGYEARANRFPDNVAPRSERSGVSVSTNQTGSAGDIIINTAQFRLEEQGAIIAESRSGNGGNILIGQSSASDLSNQSLPTPEAIFLGPESLISATAGDGQNGGDGGNISITAPFIISFPGNNSDILANAFEGTGGNIQIAASGILNIQTSNQAGFEQLRQNQSNDISASSTLGSPGSVIIETPEVEPADGLNNLPIDFVDPTALIDRRCELISNPNRSSRFVQRSRFGLPTDPSHMLQDEVFKADFGPTLAAETAINPPSQSPQPTHSSSNPPRSRLPLSEDPPAPPIEAQAWQIDNHGQVRLRANKQSQISTHHRQVCSTHQSQGRA